MLETIAASGFFEERNPSFEKPSLLDEIKRISISDMDMMLRFEECIVCEIELDTIDFT